MNFFTKKRILLISPEPWDHIAVSKHHYAKKLATMGNSVFFLNPPGAINSSRYDGDVVVVDYKTIRGINKMPSLLRSMSARILINKVEKLCGGSFDVVWTFDAFRFQNLRLFNVQLRIYHAVDIHIAPLEHELASSADLILAVSELIRKRFEKYNKPNAKINHGLADHFLQELSYEPKRMDSAAEIKVGYVGNLDNWCIDQVTLLDIVRNNPTIHFRFVGPYKIDSPLATKLLQMPHCKLEGRVPTEKLPGLLHEMDLFLMCYKGDEKDVNSNHHKILEFISTGKPSVINYTDEYDSHRSVVVMSNTNEELPGLFKEVLLNLERFNEPALVESRKNFARLNSYYSHIEAIDKLAVQILSVKL